ncbi:MULTISPECIES: GNAT family N-acetyltransferase [unclassified Streptomyces]|uniref:GNAT family N-acetyltransferase n=1 Tax=unclassified Streptomyces TaxID=2593676 RepID=UPI001F53FC0F|nr:MULTISPECIES: GNAT family N-acetyltransferase [unclassified Streptomyces]
MQGQHADPAARTRRAGRPGGHPVRLRHHHQPAARLRAGGGGPVTAHPQRDAAPPTAERGAPPPVSPADARTRPWAPVDTPAGTFQLVPADPERDLTTLTRWMNDPAVAAFWELAGDESVTAGHLAPQLADHSHSTPWIGVLSGTPISYWELYRADLDRLARYYPARPHDMGVHLLIGEARHRGRGTGTALLRAVTGLVLDHIPRCTRVVAEPDLRNTPSVLAFLRAGFRLSAEIDLPEKRAALMVRDRTPHTRP